MTSLGAAPAPRGGPTRLSLRDMRAASVLASTAGASVLVAQDIYRLPDLASWSRLVLDVAIDDLVTSGVLTDDAHGHILVQPLAEAAS